MIPPLLISHCPTYEVPKNHTESSSSFFLGCNYLRTAVLGRNKIYPCLRLYLGIQKPSFVDIHITITNFEYKFLYRHIVGICIIQTYRYLLRFEIKAISIKQGTGNRENWRTFRHLVTEDVLLKNSIIYMYRYIIYKYAPPQKSFPP